MVLALLALFGSQVPTSAFAQSHEQLAALRKQFGLDATRADFVVTVDVSGSMSQGASPPYPNVKDAYQSLVESVPDGDSVGLITFGEKATDAYLNTALKEPKDRAAAIAAIPSVADEPATDIGAGIALSLDRLERPGAAYVQTLVFLTDGKHQPPRGSEYPTTQGPNWDALQARAAKVAATHQLLVYGVGLGLGASTDIDLLRRTFPSARIVSAPASQLPDLFRDATDRADLARLRKPVSDEVSGSEIKSEVSAPADLSSPLDLRVKLTSTLPHLTVSVLVRGAKVTDRDGGVVDAIIDAPPQRLTIRPGNDATVVVHAYPERTAGGRRIGQTVKQRGFTVTLDASANVEPRDVFEKVLDGQPLDVQITPANRVVVDERMGTAVKVLIGFLAALVLGALIALLVWWRFVRTPRLGGSVRQIGGDQRSCNLKGTRMRVPGRHFQLPDTNGAVVEFFTKRGEPGNVFIRPHNPLVKAKKWGAPKILSGEQKLTGSETIEVGGVKLLYMPSRKH